MREAEALLPGHHPQAQVNAVDSPRLKHSPKPFSNHHPLLQTMPSIADYIENIQAKLDQAVVNRRNKVMDDMQAKLKEQIEKKLRDARCSANLLLRRRAATRQGQEPLHEALRGRRRRSRPRVRPRSDPTTHMEMQDRSEGALR